MEVRMSDKICLIVALSMIATQISRLTPMFISSKFPVSESFERWLRYVPVSVLSALIIPEFLTKNEVGIQVNGIYIIAGVAALVVGLWKKNMLLAMVVGIVFVAVLRNLL